MTPQVMAFIAMIGVLGYLCDRAVRALSSAADAVGAETAASTDDRARGRALVRGCCCPLALLRRCGRRGAARATGNPRTPMPTRVVSRGGRPGRPRRSAARASLQSLGRVFGGFAVAALIAIPLGLAMGTCRARRAQRRSAGRELPARSPPSRSCRSPSSGSAPARRPRC